MPSHHHHLVLQLRIRPGNLPHRIEPMLVVARKLRIDIHLNRHRHMIHRKPRQPVVVFDHHHRVRNRNRILPFLRLPRQVRAVIVEDHARPATIPPIARRRKDRHHTLIRKHLQSLHPQPLQPGPIRNQLLNVHLWLSTSPLAGRVRLHLLQLRIRISRKQRLRQIRRRPHRPQHHDLPAQSALEFIQIGRIQVHIRNLPTHCPLLASG